MTLVVQMLVLYASKRAFDFATMRQRAINKRSTTWSWRPQVTGWCAPETPRKSRALNWNPYHKENLFRQVLHIKFGLFAFLMFFPTPLRACWALRHGFGWLGMATKETARPSQNGRDLDQSDLMPRYESLVRSDEDVPGKWNYVVNLEDPFPLNPT